MSTTINIQEDFSNYFQMIQTDATASVFYTDISKHFNEGKIDAATYAQIVTSFHQNTLQEGLSTAKELAIGIRELELKTAESASKIAVDDARITGFNREYALNQARSNREIAESASRRKIDEARNNREIAESNKRIAVDEARRQLVIRQKSGFDDNLRIKSSEHSTGLYGMIQSGGMEAPSELVNFTMSALDAI